MLSLTLSYFSTAFPQPLSPLFVPTFLYLCSCPSYKPYLPADLHMSVTAALLTHPFIITGPRGGGWECFRPETLAWPYIWHLPLFQGDYISTVASSYILMCAAEVLLVRPVTYCHLVGQGGTEIMAEWTDRNKGCFPISRILPSEEEAPPKSILLTSADMTMVITFQ